MQTKTIVSPAYFTVRDERSATLRVSIDCCGDCDEEHRLDCPYIAALSMLPAGAALDSIVQDDAGDLLTLTW